MTESSSSNPYRRVPSLTQTNSVWNKHSKDNSKEKRRFKTTLKIISLATSRRPITIIIILPLSVFSNVFFLLFFRHFWTEIVFKMSPWWSPFSSSSAASSSSSAAAAARWIDRKLLPKCQSWPFWASFSLLLPFLPKCTEIRILEMLTHQIKLLTFVKATNLVRGNNCATGMTWG